MKTLYRGLVLGTLLLYGIWFFIPDAWPYLYSPDIVDLLYWNSYGALIYIPNILLYLMAIAYVIVSLGLYFFKKWARNAFVVLTIISLFMVLVNGASIQMGLSGFLATLIGYGDSAILVTSYLSTVSNYFRESD